MEQKIISCLSLRDAFESKDLLWTSVYYRIKIELVGQGIVNFYNS